MQSSREMMAPIEALARFMATGDETGLAGAFVAADAVIVENFAPFLFEGPDAFELWRSGLGSHRQVDELTELEWRFGPAQDVAVEGDVAYFVLPTTWTGKTHGRPFSEDGGWAFVLVRTEDRWRIRSYAWAVTAKR